MGIYAFESQVAGDSPPLAARRALESSGSPPTTFFELSPDGRARLIRLGSEAVVPRRLVHALLAKEGLRRDSTDVDDGLEHARPRPASVAQPPPRLMSWLGQHGVPEPQACKIWLSLSALDRFALHTVCADPSQQLDAAAEEIIGATRISTHLDASGAPRMVSVGAKPATERYAAAESWVTLSSRAFETLTATDTSELPKGDVLTTARLAGIMATKRTSDLIPLCHPISLSHADVSFETDAATHRLRIVCSASTTGPTGVEMEAMTGASVTALTIYDMLKSVDRAMTVGPTRLIEKRGGRSGRFLRSQD